MIGELSELANRPLGEHRRRSVFALAAALIVGAVALLVALPAQRAPQPAPASDSPASARRGSAATPSSEIEQPDAMARRFLDGYLRLLYGRGRASAIEGATDRLRRRLARTPLRIPPAARRREPRIVEIQTRPAGGGRFAATAEIADGGPARYPIEVTATRTPAGWRVVEVADH